MCIRDSKIMFLHSNPFSFFFALPELRMRNLLDIGGNLGAFKIVTRSDKTHHWTLWQKHHFAFKIVVILGFQSREKDLWHKCPMVGFVKSGHIYVFAQKQKLLFLCSLTLIWSETSLVFESPVTLKSRWEYKSLLRVTSIISFQPFQIFLSVLVDLW